MLNGWQGDGAGEGRVGNPQSTLWGNHPSMGNPDPQADIRYVRTGFYPRLGTPWKFFKLSCLPEKG
jgi:hypothetical protein